MNFEVSPYQLRFRAGGYRPREGVLVRWKNSQGEFCYGDLHPWTEMGDPSVGQALADLKRGRSVRVLSRMVACSGAWPVAPVPVHLLHWDGDIEATCEQAERLGINTLKIKVRSPSVSLGSGRTRFALRLDGSHAMALARDAIACGAKIDFVEDGDDSQMPSAWDGRAEQRSSDVAVIIKPFRDDPVLKAKKNLRSVVTSSLNHPLGVAQAAAFATQGETHGLSSHLVYEPDVFTDLLVIESGHLHVAPFSDFQKRLETLEWLSI